LATSSPTRTKAPHGTYRPRRGKGEEKKSPPQFSPEPPTLYNNTTKQFDWYSQQQLCLNVRTTNAMKNVRNTTNAVLVLSDKVRKRTQQLIQSVQFSRPETAADGRRWKHQQQKDGGLTTRMQQEDEPGDRNRKQETTTSAPTTGRWRCVKVWYVCRCFYNILLFMWVPNLMRILSGRKIIEKWWLRKKKRNFIYR